MKSIIELAREHASRYTNRHYPDKPVYTFHQDALERFAAIVRNTTLEEAASMFDADINYAGVAIAIRALKDKP